MEFSRKALALGKEFGIYSGVSHERLLSKRQMLGFLGHSNAVNALETDGLKWKAEQGYRFA